LGNAIVETANGGREEPMARWESAVQVFPQREMDCKNAVLGVISAEHSAICLMKKEGRKANENKEMMKIQSPGPDVRRKSAPCRGAMLIKQMTRKGERGREKGANLTRNTPELATGLLGMGKKKNAVPQIPSSKQVPCREIKCNQPCKSVTIEGRKGGENTDRDESGKEERKKNQ